MMLTQCLRAVLLATASVASAYAVYANVVSLSSDYNLVVITYRSPISAIAVLSPPGSTMPSKRSNSAGSLTCKRAFASNGVSYSRHVSNASRRKLLKQHFDGCDALTRSNRAEAALKGHQLDSI
eukprot:7636-Heterococcus_DN1.PRE.1